MRFLYQGSVPEPPKHADVVIAGMGIAGLYCALNIDPSKKVILINKDGDTVSNSAYAQGGIASVTLTEDSYEQHIADTLRAGAGLCDEGAVEVLAQEGPENMRRLLELGVPFDQDAEGKLAVTWEGAHSFRRILHCGGDATGKWITLTLLERVKERKNIEIINYAMLVDIYTNEQGAASGVLLLQNEKWVRYDTSHVVIATGGIGRIYKNSTNAVSATGDGIAAAMRAGAVVDNMEFVQFHPTALIHPGEGGRFFLISEAVRGEGGILRNRRWEAFMKDQHPLADLAPRDVVSRAIIMEMKKYNLPHVYLDITAKSREFLQKRFPTIYAECMKFDIDIAVNWIPVVPVQHYFMGGIKTNLNGETNIPGLYCVGEASCTGIHGANRLASNSLLECVVFGKRCAGQINRSQTEPPTSILPQIRHLPECTIDVDTLQSEIRVAMTKKCGILRNQSDMTVALERIMIEKERLERFGLTTQHQIETLNMLTVAEAILHAAIARKENVGAHFRTDTQASE